MSQRRTTLGHLRIHRGLGEVTHSRLKDNGMRHRHAMYTILLHNPAIWSTSIIVHRYTVDTFSVILYRVSIRSYVWVRPYYNKVMCIDIPVLEVSHFYGTTHPPRHNILLWRTRHCQLYWLIVSIDSRWYANLIIVPGRKSWRHR